MISMEAQRCGDTVLVGVSGELDAAAAPVLRRALEQVTADDRVLMIDLHEVTFMDSAGLLHLLDLHRRAECLRLRVLVIGWQPQPQQSMARPAAMPGPGPRTGESHPLAGFHRLIEERAQRESDLADLGDALLPG